MKLPNGDRSIIDRRKITDYCLSLDHDDGNRKVRLFQELIGLNQNSSTLLLDALRTVAATDDAIVGKVDEYGRRYIIDFELEGPRGMAMTRSAWIVRADEEVPRLVTCCIPSSLTRTWMIDVAETRQLLLDLVAVVRSSGDPEIQAGDVGTIVELPPSDALEVEFLSRDGRTRHIGTLSTDDVLVLNRERTRVA